MKISLVSQEKNIKKYSVEFSENEWKNCLDEAFKKDKSKYTIEGFRKGHASSRKLIETYYGKTAFFDTALQIAGDLGINELFMKEKINPTIMPSMDLEKISDCELVIVYEVTEMPEVVIKQYKGLNIKKVNAEVTDADINAEIEKDRKSLAISEEIIDGQLENNDTANINYKGLLNGEAFEGGTADNYDLKIGSGSFIPGFEEQMVGMKLNETRNINLTFPSEYHAENLAGKDVVFEVKVNKITRETLPELNDDFVKDISESASNLEEYKNEVKARLIDNAKKKADEETKSKVLDEIAKNTEFEPTEEMKEFWAEYALRDQEQQLAQYNIKPEDYYKMMGAKREDILARMKDAEANNRKVSEIIKKLVAELNIEASEESVKEKAKTLFPDSDDKKFEEDFAKYSAYIKSQVESEILMDKLVELNVVD